MGTLKVASVVQNRSVRVVFRDGLSATSTTNTTEPNAMGAAGSLLEVYRHLNMSAFKANGRVKSLRLIGACTVKNSGANTSNVKLGIRFAGNSTVRYTPAQQTTGTSPAKMYFDLDLMPNLADAVNGGMYGTVSAWGSAGTTTIGASSLTEPNVVMGLLIEVENP